MKRISLLVVAALALLSHPMGAQERLGSGAPDQTYRAGWTFTPIIGVSRDLRHQRRALQRGPSRHRRLHHGPCSPAPTCTTSASTPWWTRATRAATSTTTSSRRSTAGISARRFELRRQESARLTWFGHATAAALPSTDLIDLGGIPYRKTGATTVDGRGGVEYALGAHDTLMSSVNYQVVSFDRPEVESDILRGGRIFESMNAWRHKVSERAAIGADYSFRRALVTGDVEPFDFHTTEAALDYELSPLWSLQGGAGVVYLQADGADRGARRPGMAARAPASARRHHVSRRLSPDVHSVVRLRRHGREPGRRRRLPHAALSRAPLLPRHRRRCSATTSR